MRFFRAIGIIVGLIIIRVLLPQEFEALNTTLEVFFRAVLNFVAIVDPRLMNAASFEAAAPKIPGY